MAFLKWITNSAYTCHVCKLNCKPWEHNIFDGHDITNVVEDSIYTKDVQVCKKCSSKQLELNKLHARSAHSVQTFSHRYQGKVPKTTQSITTPKYRNRDDAEKHLKRLAVINGKKVITHLNFTKYTEVKVNLSSKNKIAKNYKYSVWKASGKI